MKIKRILKYFGISVVILIIGFLAVAQIAYQSIPYIESPGKMYSVDGVGEIHMYCTGPEDDNGKPNIIIISGGTTPSFAYFDLQEKLSETVRTCTYDTAGIGWSPANDDIPHTAKNRSNELYLLLQSAKIDGPIILAGHSLGGITSLIYSTEHEEQVAGIAFIDSSHYNQYDYFGEEYSDVTFDQIEAPLPYVWLIELSSNLGVPKLMAIFDTSMSEEHVEEHNMLESIHKQNSPYSTMKSMASNFRLSFEQGKEAHYDRGNLPIVVLTAGSPIVSNSQEIEGVSTEEFREGFDILQKDLAELSSNSKHVIVNGTNHGSILDNDETAQHILSLISKITHATTFDSEIEPYDYEDVCGFPITDEMRLDAILEGSTHFSNDGYSYLTLRGGTFSHVGMSTFSTDDNPTLQYWFTLRNGHQVYFSMDACEIKGVSNGSKISLGTPMEQYYALHPPTTGEDSYEIMSAPGHFLIHSVTREPVLDVKNCERIPKYYTAMQSDTMFTEENVTFDPLWKNQLFPLMDYCTDIGNFELDITDGKRYWSFKVK